MYIYDAANRSSFENIKKWVTLIRDKNPSKKVPCKVSKDLGVVVGNKIDLENRSLVRKELAQELASSLGGELFQVSAVFLYYSV